MSDQHDEHSFHLLDGYVQDLHAGRQPDRAKFIAEHPELASYLDFLDGLEELAPPPPARRPPNPFDPDRTLDENEGAAKTGDRTSPTGGEIVGKYELLGEIGRGGMGVIYKARQIDLDRTVAIKMILASNLASRAQVERFAAEAKAMAKLHHPNVVRVHETGEHQGQQYFVMEYITGQSLAELSRHGMMPAERAARLVALIARAVQHLHEQGIVHRDLKPSNVLLDEQGQPYVTDFGLVKLVGSSNVTTTGAIVGTPAYMAPEQAAGRPELVGPCSDVYALGAILYELLTGRPPYQGETPLDTLVQVIEGEPTRPRLLNPALARPLETICLKCLEKDPGERYVSAAALAQDLERVLEGDAVEARQPGLLHLLRRWARREPALVYRLGALGALMAVVQANYWLTGTVSWEVHVRVQCLAAAWMVTSVICQQLLKRERWTEIARLAWSGADAILLSVMLAFTGSQSTVLVIGYPFLIATSGLWFQVREVWFTTAVCEVTYLILILTAPAALFQYLPHYHIIFMVTLALLGFVVAYQVQRIRVLNRYYENRPLP